MSIIKPIERVKAALNGSISKSIFRHRGLKICESCGEINGQRAQVCRNENCELRKKILNSRRPLDPVQLVTLNGTAIYSVRSKERDLRQRNFVQISELTLSELENSTIVSRYAVCFVDTCKYDAFDAACIECKHIRAIAPDATKAPLSKAEVYPISCQVLWHLNISATDKERLWQWYEADKDSVPAVQRLNWSTFAVKCEKSKSFTAGRLHVTVMPNGQQSKSGVYGCACKKLKIILEADNSVIMKDDVCDHIVLVLAAILTQSEGRFMFGNFVNALKAFWLSEDPKADTSPLEKKEEEEKTDAKLDGPAPNPDDIFIFNDDFFNEQNLPDFSDIILNMPPSNTTHGAEMPVVSASEVSAITAGDPNFYTNSQVTDAEMQMANEALSMLTESSPAPDASNSAHMQLNECNIELMDHLKLTDQLDLNADDIALPPESAALFDSDNLNNLSPSLYTEEKPSPGELLTPMAAPISNNSTVKIEVPDLPLAPISLPINSEGITKVPGLTVIEMPTITMVKPASIKISEITHEVNTRKFPHIPIKRSLIVNTASKADRQMPTEAGNRDDSSDSKSEPSLAFSAWLDHVIEIINDSVYITSESRVKHGFHVHEEIFAHFSKTFSIGSKLRMPNLTTVLKSGKYKGLIKYTWYFPRASTAKRIFSSKNISLITERHFECNEEGAFVPYVRRALENPDPKKRRIYPKISLYSAYIFFDLSDCDHNVGLKLEWLPNAFPKSHFGIMNVEFSLGVRQPIDAVPCKN